MLIHDVMSIGIPAVMSLFVGMFLSRKLADLERETTRDDRIMLALKALEPPVLRRPTYRPRRRFPFRTVCVVSAWTILVTLASVGPAQCTPDPQPAFQIVSCAHDHDDSTLARVSCSIAATLVVETIQRIGR